jgi:hypothetical protein
MSELREIVAETAVAMKELAESQKRTELAQQKTELAQQKTELALQRTQQTLEKTIEELSGNIYGVNRRLGEIVEMVVLPCLMKKMNELNHKFTMSSPQKRFSRDGKHIAEIDLLLENCDEIMAVEAKARFKLGDMNRFLKRIELLRENEDVTGAAGKTIYAAAAAIGFDKNARELARELGMYLIDIDQDNDNIEVTPPPDGKAGTW